MTIIYSERTSKKDYIFEPKEFSLYKNETTDNFKYKVIEQLKIVYYSRQFVTALLNLDMSQAKCFLKHFEKSFKIHLLSQRTTIYIQQIAINEEHINGFKKYFENKEYKHVIVRKVKVALK